MAGMDTAGAPPQSPKHPDLQVTTRSRSRRRLPTAVDIVGDRQGLVMIGMAAVWLACVLFAASRLAVTLSTGKLTPWWANLAGAVAITVLYLWYRGNPQRRSPVAASGTALVATLALLVPVAYGMASTVWWLGLVGFAMVMLGRRGEAWVWGVAVPLLAVATTIIEPSVQLEGAAGEPPIERGLARIIFVVLLVGMALAFRRVAERRAKALFDSDERYRMLFQRVPVGVFHCDPDLRITECNERFADIFGMTREGVIGRAVSELARGLSERWPKLKVILMSGYTEDEAVRRGAVSGHVHFLQKPFDMASLAREIRTALEE
jgi:PAS domain-containing protein